MDGVADGRKTPWGSLREMVPGCHGIMSLSPGDCDAVDFTLSVDWLFAHMFRFAVFVQNRSPCILGMTAEQSGRTSNQKHACTCGPWPAGNP